MPWSADDVEREPRCECHGRGKRFCDGPPNVDLPSIGRYRIRRRLGAGAFGTVYRAFDPHLNREIALKVPNPGAVEAPERVERFLREAQAAAALRHPNIVPVFDTGEASTLLYIASAFIDGPPLSRTVPAHGTEIERAARIVGTLAGAAHYAHGQGIVHRDIKPANILMDSHDNPHLADFGLAAQAGIDRLTSEGAVLGSPAYMAPEQASGQIGDARPEADQYSLGIVLYELLTGRTPFAGRVDRVLYDQVHTDPAPPRSLRAEIPRDLETICLKAISKRPSDRYANCQDLANDLRRWQEGEPIAARRLGMIERLNRWVGRNRGLAASLAGVATLLILLAAGSIVAALYFQDQESRQRLVAESEERQRKDAVPARNLAEARRIDMRRNLYFAEMNLAGQAADSVSGLGRVEEYVSAWRGDPLCGWEWRYLNGLCRRELFTLRGHTDRVREVAWDRDGRLLASVSDDGVVRVWDVARKKEVQTLKRNSPLRALAWNPEGTRIACGGGAGDVEVWSLDEASSPILLKGHTDTVLAISWKGDRLASSGNDDRVIVWDLAAARPATILQTASDVVAIDWHPRQEKLAAGLKTGGVRVWDSLNRKPRAFHAHNSGVSSVQWNATGDALVTAGNDETAKIWSVSGDHRATLTGHLGQVFAAAWSPDGQRIATGAYDRTVKIWSAGDGSRIHTLRGHSRTVYGVSWNDKGGQVASAGADGAIKIWDAIRGDRSVRLAGAGGKSSSIAWSPDNSQIAFPSNGSVIIADAANGTRLRTLQKGAGKTGSQAISWKDTGDKMATIGEPPSIDIWNVRAGVVEKSIPMSVKTSIRSLEWKPGSAHLAAAMADGVVSVWNSVTGERLGERRFDRGGCYSVAWERGGGRIAVARGNGSVTIWNAASGKDDLELTGHTGGVRVVAWNHAGDKIASGGDDATVRIWDAHTGDALHVLREHTSEVMSLAWSPDGVRLASTGRDGGARLWDTKTGQLVLTIRNGPGHFVRWSPDGKRLAWSGPAQIALFDATFGE